ncbi:hypothetical protein, partial [Dysgonomonas capnocytophagoides]|uniref:hypothetical protein n=1 Tax=Dysgonomonas capnocytophagoides TaxID=45254 RepID=UPI002A7F9A3B
MKRKTKRIFSMLLALAVMATMLTALTLTGYAASVNSSSPDVKLDYFGDVPSSISASGEGKISMYKVDYAGKTISSTEKADFDITIYYDTADGSTPDSGKTVKTSSQPTVNPLTGITSNYYYVPDDSAYRNGTSSTNEDGVYGLRFKFTPNVNGTLYVYNKQGNNKSMTIKNLTDGSSESQGNVKDVDATISVNETPSIVSDVKYGIFEVKANNEYVVYMNSGTGNGCRGFGFVSKAANVELENSELSIVPGGTAQINATADNFNEGYEFSYTMADGSPEGITVDKDGLVTVGSEVEAGANATVVVTCTDGTNTATANCAITVVAPSNDIVIKGAAGIKKLTVNGPDGYTKSIEWSRTSGSEASLNDGNSDVYGTDDVTLSDGSTKIGKRSYLRTIKGAPLGEYTVTVDAADIVSEYYEISVPETFTLTADYVYTGTNPLITVTSTAKAGGAIREEGFDYAAVQTNGSGTITWDFTKKTGTANEYISLQGKDDCGIYTQSYTEGFYMIVNTKEGKFNSIDRPGDIQINAGTVIKLFAAPNTKFTFTGVGFTIDGTEYKSGSSYTYTGKENGVVTATCTGGYLQKIQAEYPQLKATFGESATDS